MSFQKKKSVEVVPTYVRPTNELTKEDCAYNFQEHKPISEWAKKGVVQPAKLITAKVESAEVLFGTKKYVLKYFNSKFKLLKIFKLSSLK